MYDKILYLTLSLTFLVACTSKATIGTKSHEFDAKANHIVWIQVDGLSPEHLALTKIGSEAKSSPFDSFRCLGFIWNYNLYKLRPSANEGFLGQELGSQNIKGSCRDIDRASVWSFFQRVGYSAGIFHSQNKLSEHFDYSGCEEYKALVDKTWVWKREKVKDGGSLFHHQESMLSGSPKVAFDKSCQQSECKVDFVTHAFNAWDALKSKSNRTFFVVKDYMFKKHLLSKDLTRAKIRLSEIEKLIRLIEKESPKLSISIVVSTSESYKLDLPLQGKKWLDLKNNKKVSGYRSPSLVSYVWGKGPGTENFCGAYNESEVMKRFLWMAEGNFFESFIFN